MIESIIGFIREIPEALIYDAGLIIMLAVGFLAIIVLELWFSLNYSVNTTKLSKQLDAEKLRDKEDFERVSKLVDSSSIQITADYWYKNITVNPSEKFEVAWKRTDHLLLAQAAVANLGYKTKARYVPSIIILFSILTSALGAFVHITQADNPQIADAWKNGWQRTIILLIVGIIVSVLFVIIDALLTTNAVKKTRLLFDISSDIMPTIGDEDWRFMHLHEIKITNSRISSLEDRLVETLVKAGDEHLFPGLINSYKMALEEHLVPEIAELRISTEQYSAKVLQLQQTGMAELADSFYNKLSTNIDVQLERQSSTIEKLNHMQQVGAERLELIMSRSNDNLSMQRDLNEHALQTIEGITASQSSLAEAAERLASGMRSAGELADGMQALLQADRELLSVLATDREEMQRLNDGYYEKMNNQILQLQDDLNSEITSLLSRFTDIYSVTFENIEEQTGGLIENFENQTRSLMESLDSQIRDLTFLTKDVTAEIADLNKNLKESTLEYSNGIESSLNGHLSSLDTNVNELMSKLASTTELIRESVDDLPAAVLLARMSIEGGSDRSNNGK